MKEEQVLFTYATQFTPLSDDEVISCFVNDYYEAYLRFRNSNGKRWEMDFDLEQILRELNDRHLFNKAMDSALLAEFKNLGENKCYDCGHLLSSKFVSYLLVSPKGQAFDVFSNEKGCTKHAFCESCAKKRKQRQKEIEQKKALRNLIIGIAIVCIAFISFVGFMLYIVFR